MWENLKITDEENEITDADGMINERIVQKGALCLLGKVFSQKHVNVKAMISTLIKAWDVPRRIKGVAIGDNSTLFQFPTEMDKKRVLEGVPWALDHNLMLLAGYDGDVQPSKIQFKSSCF